MRWTLALVALLSASANEAAAQGKGIRLWNLTTATISEFQLSPAGKNDWGPNQIFQGKLSRTIATLAHTLNDRGDPKETFTAELDIHPPAAP